VKNFLLKCNFLFAWKEEREGGGYERMLLDSIIVYIAYLTLIVSSFTRSIAEIFLSFSAGQFGSFKFFLSHQF
jgi:hypothetical protein